MVDRKNARRKTEPTMQELKFIYSRVDELSDQELLAEMQTVGFPVRSVGFIKRRREEFEAARYVLHEQLQTRAKSVTLISKEEHLERLVEMVNILLAGELAKTLPEGTTDDGMDTYTIVGEELETITHQELVSRFEANIDKACARYSERDFWECFLPHLIADYPELESKDLHDIISSSPLDLLDVLRLLDLKKTFKGTCPVCEDWA